jgi:hypothetical protein
MCGTRQPPVSQLRKRRGSRARRWVQDCSLPLYDRPLCREPALLLFTSQRLRKQQVYKSLLRIGMYMSHCYAFQGMP